MTPGQKLVAVSTNAKLLRCERGDSLWTAEELVQVDAAFRIIEALMDAQVPAQAS